jgi:hypothetical protein
MRFFFKILVIYSFLLKKIFPASWWTLFEKIFMNWILFSPLIPENSFTRVVLIWKKGFHRRFKRWRIKLFSDLLKTSRKKKDLHPISLVMMRILIENKCSFLHFKFACFALREVFKINLHRTLKSLESSSDENAYFFLRWKIKKRDYWHGEGWGRMMKKDIFFLEQTWNSLMNYHAKNIIIKEKSFLVTYWKTSLDIIYTITWKYLSNWTNDVRKFLFWQMFSLVSEKNDE